MICSRILFLRLSKGQDSHAAECPQVQLFKFGINGLFGSLEREESRGEESSGKESSGKESRGE